MEELSWRRNHPSAISAGKAVDAELPGTDGKRYRLFELAGPNGLVVVFICNHCPYVRAVIDRMVRDAADLARRMVSASSRSVPMTPTPIRKTSFDNMARFAAAHRFGFPYLYDEDQSVARAYDAACTPDFFGFNRDLKLQYRGPLDAAARGRAGGLRRDLYEAMVQIAHTGEGPRDQIASIGCSIKWKHAA